MTDTFMHTSLQQLANSGRALRLGIYGGTFDPVHIGHLHVAACALNQYQLDYVLFIPTGRPVRKLDSRFSSGVHRLAMLKLATANNPQFLVSDMEVVREGTTYTIDTLNVLISELGLGAKLFFIAGYDTAVDMPTWKDSAQIAKLVEVLYARRRMDDKTCSACALGNVDQDESALLKNNSEFTYLPITSMLLDVSSIKLRTWVNEEKDINYLVADEVYKYILDVGLYCKD